MNAHEDFENLVQPYLAGGLSPTEREAFDRHLIDCVDCTTALADAQEFTAFMNENLASLRPPEGLEDRLVSRMGLRTRRTEARRRSLPSWARLAAAALLFIAVGAYATNAFPSELYSPGAFGGLSREDSANGRVSGSGAFGLADGRLGPESAAVGAWIKDWGESYTPVTNLDGDAPLQPEGVASSGMFSLGVGDPMADPETSREADGVTSLKRSFNARVLNQPLGDTETSLPASTGFDFFEVDDGLRELSIALPRVADPTRSVPQDSQDRKIIRNGTLELEVDSFDAAFAGITDLVTENGGFVSSSSRQKLANGKIMGTVVVRVPQAGFSSVVLALAELGDLKNQSVSSQEVTKQYVDLSSRLRSKRVLEERLITMLEEAEGELKDLLVVEKELGQVRGEIERIQGELNYYDNLVSLSTITLNLRERDIGQPFEYVQTLESQIGVVVEDVETAYEQAQEIISEHQGRILDAGMTRQGEDQATGRIVAEVDADSFPAVREALRALGDVNTDMATRKQQPRGGTGGTPSPNAPVSREKARVSLQLTTPPTVITLNGNLSVIAEDPEAAFQSARLAVEASGGRVLGGGMTDHVDGSSGTLQIQVDSARARALVDQLENLGEVESSTLTQQTPGDSGLRRERGEILLSIASPASLVDRSEGIGAMFRGMISGSIQGIFWSLQMLVVGIAYTGPWLLVLLLLVAIYRRISRKKPVGVTGAGS